ncbi:MAG: dihydroorotase [Pseudomonadota bacterium]|jgi:dihydroorotase|uniref:Dihydroorotase n=1 Tax=Marisediminitalea aggregata TaxID=634436 RepID=A0A1M5DYM1_9ALTE|nr:dihydroorotase [Marisediminitalea aggregata]MCP3865339.1 dihydroorotase [Aestuariibacter sp.]MEC8227121.1 dihydroorotase [Pseudomonadota bacterium]BBO29304.1 dihydroorotase [Alteromonas sp. I4]MCP4237282.1 dihydroorotase [Aestuariibacter sp.]MCP4526304.1 dihydroorotase [Aestuariibacter sp.]|tara:strand:- start:2663 stop:3694 length:1032 start_codon:yes stop_codon:yes gene_type:complete
MQSITLRQPDDWHLHFRDNDMLAETVPATARCFARAIVMPNLVPPVTNAELAMAYKARIEAARPAGSQFEPLMTLYLTNQTTPADITAAKAAGVVACKLYPAGATTNSDAAVKGINALYPVFEQMEKDGVLLLIHGEVTESHVDIFDREKVFIDQYMAKIVKDFPGLKVVFEHITTADAADFVLANGDNIAATITPQHLLLNRNDLLVGGVRPHNYCLPVLKRNTHQQRLREVVAEGSAKFFLGTDSAPHAKHRKENACGCAGCYSAWSAIELYAEVFEQLDALDKFEAFASENGPDFYGLPRNTGTITLVKESWQVPEMVTLADGTEMVPFFAGQTLNWKLA